MTSVAPMPIIAPGSADIGRPGQQLLPGYVVKLLKTLKIPFGTDRTMNGVDVDPSINLIGHIIDCLGALRDVNKVYRAKGSLASRSVGTRTMFGFTAELGNILLDAITFDPPNDLSDSSLYYGQVATSILNVFPEIAAQVTPSTGKVLIHHTALKASATMAMESIKMVIKAFPAGAWTTDRTGALPLHWITHNSYCNSDMINYLINANPKGPWVADCDGYLPLHWAVNQDAPNIDVVAALIAANVSASAKACLKGSLPLHWCVNRDLPNMAVLRALLQVHADGVRTFDKTGWLPLHQCVNRSNISLDALNLLIELYPQGLQCPNVNGQLPLHRALDQLSPSVEAIHMMLEAFPGGSKVADDEGYLPIHLALDCARPNPVIAKMLLDHYPESAFHKSKDGLLPIHCIISSMNPVVEIIQSLLIIFPDSTESMAVDVIPVDESADPETWTGEWVEKRWTPLSRAIDRGLDAIVILFRDALNASKNYALVANQQQQQGAGGAPSATGGGSKYNTATPKTLMTQSKPPLNNLSTPSVQRGPSTSSNEGVNHNHSSNAINRLVLGGNLDSPSRNNEGGMHDYDDNNGFDPNIGEFTNVPPLQQSPPQGRTLPVSINNPNLSGHNLRVNGEGSISNGPMSHRPSTGGPPQMLSQHPYHGSAPSLKDRGPVARGDKHSDAKNRERERQSSRDRERRDDRDRERDRDGEKRRHRSSSRNHRDNRYYEEEDRDSRGHHHRSSNRSSSKDRRSSRESDRDRDRERRGGAGGDRESRDRDRERRSNHHQPPSQPRIYEQTNYDDDDVDNDYQNNHTDNNSYEEHVPDDSRGAGGVHGSKMRMMNASIGPPSSEPPKTLVDAANRPFSRRGPNDVPSPNNNNYVGGGAAGGNQINHSTSRDHQYSRDNSNELGEYVDQAVVEIRHDGGGGMMMPHRPLSIDDIV